MKIVLVRSYGLLCLSEEPLKRYKELSGGNPSWERDDPALIQVVEEFQKKDEESCNGLKIVEIPDGVDWQIEGSDGYEWVAENHRTWF